MSPLGDPDSGRPRVEPSPAEAPGGRSAPGDADLATEVAALATLLADVVRLTGDSALFPSRWELIAELALEHDSVRTALRAEEGGTPPLDTEHIIAQLDSLHDLIGDDGHARC
jgi:hypothetical protein